MSIMTFRDGSIYFFEKGVGYKLTCYGFTIHFMTSKPCIAVVANANSTLKIRWSDWLHQRNHEVTIFSLKEGADYLYLSSESIFNLV
jgi:hypothetical protein